MAQISLTCQFCEISSEVKKKCDTCDLLLCETCNNKIHSKIRDSNSHIIHDLVDSDTATEHFRKVELKSIQCSTHTDEKCFTFCRTCDKSLCSLCVVSSHQAEELETIFENKTQELTTLKEDIEKALPFFEKNAEDITQMESEAVTKHTNIKEKIHEKKNKLLTETEYLNDSLNYIWNPEKNELTEEKNRLCKIKEDLIERKDKLGNVLKEKIPSEVFPLCEQINKIIPEQNVLSTKVPGFHYTETVSANAQFLGSVINIPEITLVRIFKTDLPDISSIASLNKEISVIYSAEKHGFQEFTISDSKFIPTHPFRKKQMPEKGKIGAVRAEWESSITLVHMSTYTGGILINDSYYGGEVMHFNKEDSKFGKITSINPIIPIGICGDQNNIIVGYRDEQKSQAGILLLNGQGEEIRKIGFSTKNYQGKLFDLPGKIAKNINGDICILDYKNFKFVKNANTGNCDTCQITSRDGRLVVLGPWGEPKWTYDGHYSINRGRFYPCDLVTTPLGIILVADTYVIHVLSMHGEFLTKYGEEHGIKSPVSLNINGEGKLMVGCSNYYNYLRNFSELYVFKFEQKAQLYRSPASSFSFSCNSIIGLHDPNELNYISM